MSAQPDPPILGFLQLIAGSPRDLTRPRAFDRVPAEDLRPLLSAHVHAEQMRASRTTVLHLLAVAGGLCWLMMSWPRVLPPKWHIVALVGWPMGLALLLLFVFLERKWSSRLVRLTKR